MLRLCCLLLLIAIPFVVGERGCPPEEDIRPCTCDEQVYVNLQCGFISDIETLLKVFHKAEDYHFNKFTLINSTLQYIPHDIFNNVEVKVMNLEDVTFHDTFDELPKNPGLKSLYVYNAKIMTGFNWKHLSIFTELEDLSIEDISMKRLSIDFRPNVSKKLKALRLSWCKLRKFRDAEFTEFWDLEIFAAVHDNLSELKRTMFSRESKLREISFEYNQLTALPGDMFSNMPNLKLVALGNNKLKSMFPKVYKDLFGRVDILRLQDNDFECNCKMEWLVTEVRKVPHLYGKCTGPKKLENKLLKDLRAEDFNC